MARAIRSRRLRRRTASARTGAGATGWTVWAGAAGAAGMVASASAAVAKNANISLASARDDRRREAVHLGLPGARHLVDGERVGVVGMERPVGPRVGLRRRCGALRVRDPDDAHLGAGRRVRDERADDVTLLVDDGVLRADGDGQSDRGGVEG